MADTSQASPASADSASQTPIARSFKPRAGVQRRTRAERDKFAKEEADREAKRVREGGRTGAAAAGPERGRGTKTQGGATRSDAKLRSHADGGGIFGAASVGKPAARSRDTVGAGSDELIEAGEALKALETATETQTHVPVKVKKHVTVTDPKEEGAADAAVSSKLVETNIEIDEEPDEDRRDIERIWISSEDEHPGGEDDATGRSERKAQKQFARFTGGLRPVRAPRARQEEADGATVKDKAPSKAGRKTTTEPVDVDEVVVHEQDLAREVPSSPEAKKKYLKRPPGKAKEVKLANETPEDRTERLRVAQDNATLKNIFIAGSPVTTQADEKTTPGGEGKLFLLQFPPLTPLLIDCNDPQQQEDGAADATEETAPAANPGTAKQSHIKKEPGAANSKLNSQAFKDSHDHNGVFAACCPATRLASGYVGKLNVHASGKITLDWGGTDMEVKLGTEVDFLQDAVMLQTKTEQGQREDQDLPRQDLAAVHEVADGHNNKAVSLGQIHAKMVVVPDWTIRKFCYEHGTETSTAYAVGAGIDV